MHRISVCPLIAAGSMFLLVAAGCGPKADETPPPEKPSGGGEVTPDEPPAEPAEPEADPELAQKNEDLIDAVENYEWIPARLAITEGADKSLAVGKEGVTELHVAALIGDKASVEKLLEGGADIEAKTGNGETPLIMAAYSGSKDVVKLLIDKGADIKALDDDSGSILHAAVLSGNTDLVVFLVTEKKVPVSTKQEEGCPPLFAAVESLSIDMVKALVGKGAKAGSSCNGVTPLHIAAAANALDLVEFLLSKGGKATATNMDEQTPLHLAAAECPTGESCMEVVKLLVKKGAKKSKKDGLGKTPLDYANERGDTEMADFLK